MLESAVEKHFCRRVEEHGGAQRKLNPVGQNFWPDRLASTLVTGAFLVELKRPKGGRLSKGQVERIKLLEAAGFKVFVAWTKEMVDAIFSGENS